MATGVRLADDMRQTAELPPLVDRIPALPEFRHMHGPITRRILRRFYVLQGLVFALGLIPLLLGWSGRWQAFGLGLILPGAGFLYAGGLAGAIFALFSLVAFVVALFIWWARGAVVGPPVILLGSALLAALWIGDGQGTAAVAYAVPAAFVLLHLMAASRRQRKFQSERERGREHNRALAASAPVMRQRPLSVWPELRGAQIEEFRRVLDLALQPIDSWTGISFDDVYQDGAARYKISKSGWNLSYLQFSRLPAFHGYLNTAQENLIHKLVHRRVWDYWFRESLWGNFRIAKNPVAIDNIMLTGFLGMSLGLYETSSGLSRFAKEGDLTFRWDEKTAFPYSHKTLLGELVKNYKRHEYGFYPCEPNWIYTMCNHTGRIALELYDARHGTDMAGEIRVRYDRTMDEEWMFPDGRLRACTSSRFGFTIPSLTGLIGGTSSMLYLATFDPARAERLWHTMKRDYFTIDANGALQCRLLPLGWDVRRPANFSYKEWPELIPMSMVYQSALHMGDDEVATVTASTIDERYGAGISEALTTWIRPNVGHDMITQGLPEAWRTGPILAEAPYPDAIVTRAVTDGEALEVVMVPGGDPKRVELEFARLRPGRTYRIKESGEAIIADGLGRARYDLALDSRRELTIVPVV